MKKKYFNGRNNFKTINIKFWLISLMRYRPQMIEYLYLKKHEIHEEIKFFDIEYYC